MHTDDDPGAVMDDLDCPCEFDPIPGDPLEGTPETAWHYRRTCPGCRTFWYSLHCPHEHVQNPCPNCGLRSQEPGT